MHKETNEVHGRLFNKKYILLNRVSKEVSIPVKKDYKPRQITPRFVV